MGNWRLQTPWEPAHVLPRGCKKGRSCLVPALTAQFSTSTGWLYIPRAPCTPRAPGCSLRKTGPVAAGLTQQVWGSQSEEAFLGISAALSYSSRSFCPKGSSDVQNRLWCQYESSIVRLGTDNALGRLFIYKSTQCSPLPFSLQMQIERPSSCKSNRLV